MPEHAPRIRYSDGLDREGQALRPTQVPRLGLDGVDLKFIRIDHQTRLQFEAAEVVIGTSFRFITDGRERTLDPEKRADLGPVLAIYPTSLASAVVEANLTLSLTFENGSRIDVPQNPHYEAWQVVGPGSRLIVCPPEGNGTPVVWT